MRCRSRPAWSYWRRRAAGGREKVRRARWKEERGWVGRGEGWVGAEKALWDGGLRQMSVPGGEERVKAGSLCVVEAVGDDMVAVVGSAVRRRG